MHQSASFSIDNSSIKKCINFIRMINCDMDRLNTVSCITLQSMRNTAGLKIFKNMPVWFNSINSNIFHHIGKTFIQPKVIPPLHSYQITKPLMRQFMSNNKCNLLAAANGRIFINKKINLTISD